MLKGKHIILGISGGIAAYKAVSLLRLLVKAGAEVQPVITPNGKEFITPVTLSALCRRPVISEFFTANTGQWNSHVDLSLWADAMIIAPATASTIAKMAHGVADNMLVTTYLSAREKVFIAPAMDLDMWNHPTTSRNLEILKADGVTIIQPEAGELASGLIGKGRMEEPERIFEVLADYFAPANQPLAGKKILITAGPTVEPIDPVRYISNHSSGKMGFAIASEALRRGADVYLVAGPVTAKIDDCERLHRIDVTTARQMCDECTALFPDMDAAIMCAAVADYAPEHVASSKIKRTDTDPLTIKLVPNPDIAATLGKLKRLGQTLVGFALETDNAISNAKSKLERKNLDAIVLNDITDPQAGFSIDTNKITIIRRDGDTLHFPAKPKTEVAADILENICF